MKKVTVWLVVVFALGIAGCSGGGNTKVVLKNAVDSASYALGVNTGGSYFSSEFPGEELNIDLIALGFAQSIKGQGTKLSMDESAVYLNDYFNEAANIDAAMNKEEGETFLAQNSLQDGVIVTESGLQYQVLTQGTGPKPNVLDEVTVHYTGRLIDGTVFDSSEGGDPVTFGLNQVITGWTEALQLMPVGSTYRIWIPSDLGYGETGSGPIPASSVLDFEVQLIGIAE